MTKLLQAPVHVEVHEQVRLSYRGAVMVNNVGPMRSGCPRGDEALSDEALSDALGLDLLQLEDVLVELQLQTLVGVVDAELLERVGLQDLEPEDVQDADTVAEVDLLDEPRGGARVHALDVVLVVHLVQHLHRHSPSPAFTWLPSGIFG
jgi:hypothetical protein